MKYNKFKYVEHIAEEVGSVGSDVNYNFHNAERRVSFNRCVEAFAPVYSDDVLIKFDNDEFIRKSYRDAVHTPGFIGSGILEFEDYGFFENCALPIDLKRQESIIGEPLCWGCDFAEWYANEHNLDALFERHLEGGYFSKAINRIIDHRVNEECIIMSAPGQEIYGHWLLDILPRLHVLSLSDHFDKPIYFNHVPEWSWIFLNSFGIDRRRIRPHPSRFFKPRRAIVPTSSKSGYRLGVEAMKKAWARVERPGRVELPSDCIGEKVFLSRRGWAGARSSFDNISDLEDLAESRGYKIVRPEKLSVVQQIRVMQNARFVMGEDGSALHNVIFSEPGLRLGVLSLPERANLWHLSICHVMGHRAAYCYGQSDQSIIGLQKLDDFIDVLESV